MTWSHLEIASWLIKILLTLTLVKMSPLFHLLFLYLLLPLLGFRMVRYHLHCSISSGSQHWSINTLSSIRILVSRETFLFLCFVLTMWMPFTHNFKMAFWKHSVSENFEKMEVEKASRGYWKGGVGERKKFGINILTDFKHRSDDILKKILIYLCQYYDT